ncbi:KinB-signaling pathway activation protein [Alkalibacillus haloalkaliphilus]|uniref:KinB-signaling pathway activation protein n=1 Tax=Alkalibacillus haloalkaliphilus TaxID=94136 RepID=A0A511W7F1_9BACI|nr:KinB-signaling pathway activation protein [Alkalibacillus haloalkaliphilus]GEN46967.1 KinB-signaling pathway activation protein [Alkalibacillus haloalkaliphilus]
MTIRVWLKFFIMLLAIGAISTVITSFFVSTHAYEPYLNPFDPWEIFGALLWYSGYGLVFSVIAQMGFFAYLTLHQFGKGFFGRFWTHAQVIMIGFVLFELVYLRYHQDAGPEGLFPYIVVAAMIAIYGYAVAKLKAKETHPRAFLPALFFMIVVTTIEWIPALQTGDPEWIMLMVVPLLACNTYQLLKLHRIVGFNNPEDTEAKKSQQTNTKPNQNGKKKK